MIDRIKLAEAMGWIHETGGGRDWYHPSDNRSRCFANQLPDPETDANDDYAVLEWMRDFADADEPKLLRAERALNQLQADAMRDWALGYEIGDYARAALRVIE